MSIAHALLILPPLFVYSQAPAPAISFEKTHHDFGRIPQDQKVSHRVTVSNVGSAALRVKDIRVSCDCSDTTVGKRDLGPGESTFLEIRFNPANMMGNVHKSLEVVSNDPATPITVLTFEASVVRDIMPSATAVFFHKVPRGGTVGSSILLQSGNGERVVVTDAAIPDAPYLSCSPRSEGADAALDIALDGRLVPKQTQKGAATLTVGTTSKKVPVLRFHIQWDAEPFIAAAPERMVWSEVAGKELRATVRLTSTVNRAFRVLDAKSSSPLINVTGLDDASSIEHEFDVVLSSKAKPRTYNEVLTLVLDDPEQPTLEYRVVAALRNET
jgi:hypothetical protein